MIAPARIIVGGGSLGDDWKKEPDALPEFLGRPLEVFVKDILETSSTAVDLGSLAMKITNVYGSSVADSWRSTTFKAFLQELGIERLAFSSVPPGYAYLAGKHEAPKESQAIIYSIDPQIKDAIELCRLYLGLPLLQKEDYGKILEALSEEVQIKPFDMAEISKAVRDRCVAGGQPVGRNAVNFVMRALYIGGHHFDPDLDQSPATLAQGLMKSILAGLDMKGVHIDADTKQRLIRHLSGGLLDKIEEHAAAGSMSDLAEAI